MAMEMDPDGGPGGHREMDDLPLERESLCPTHGPVDPLVAGSRLKCPAYGMFLKKPGETALARILAPPGGGVKEALRRQEIREILKATQRTLSSLPPEAQNSLRATRLESRHSRGIKARGANSFADRR